MVETPVQSLRAGGFRPIVSVPQFRERTI